MLVGCEAAGMVGCQALPRVDVAGYWWVGPSHAWLVAWKGSPGPGSCPQVAGPGYEATGYMLQVVLKLVLVSWWVGPILDTAGYYVWGNLDLMTACFFVKLDPDMAI